MQQRQLQHLFPLTNARVIDLAIHEGDGDLILPTILAASTLEVLVYSLYLGRYVLEGVLKLL